MEERTSDLSPEGPEVALVLAKKSPTSLGYRVPMPGQSARSRMRTLVLLGGSVGIGSGVALGAFGLLPASVMAIGLATFQVVAQTMHQNRLGQQVMGGIAGGELERALRAAERALVESPSGGMRTLAAANLASVLMQADRVAEGIRVLERYPPGFFHMQLSTVLWLNNRAFAALIQGDAAEIAGKYLDEAERRIQKSDAQLFGGDHNYRKIASAVASNRGLYCLAANDPKAALKNLDRARQLDQAVGFPFRVAERELCRVDALRRLGRADEAKLILIELSEAPLTPRQAGKLRELKGKLGLTLPPLPSSLD